MASLDEILAQNSPTGALPDFASAIGKKPSNQSALGAGVSAGVDNLKSLGGAFVAAIGDVMGSKGIKDWGVDVAQRNAESAAANRPDLDVAPWNEGGASVLPWLLKQSASQLPQLGVQIAAGSVLGRAIPRGMQAELGRVGAEVPRALGGGGGLRAGMTFGERKAALEAGQDFGRTAVGAAAVGYPLGVGSMYQEAIERGDPNAGDAAQALLMGPAYAALDAIEPAALKGLVKRGQEGKLATRILTSAFAGAVSEMPQEAVQTAMEQTFRPDISIADKMKNIVDAAVTGGAVGGFLGGAAGIRRAKPSEITTEELDAGTAQALGTEPLAPPQIEQEKRLALPAPAAKPAPEALALTNDERPRERPFADKSPEQLQSMLTDVETRMATQHPSVITQQDKIMRAQLQAEVEARATPAAEPAPFEPGAPPVIPGFETLPERGTPEVEAAKREEMQAKQDAARAAEQQRNQAATEEVQTKAKSFIASAAGLKAIPKSLQAAQGINDEMDAMAHVRDLLNKGNTADWVVRAGKKIGLLDENGQDQSRDTIQKRIDNLVTKEQGLYQKLSQLKTKQNEVQLQRVQSQLTDLRRQQKVVAAIDERTAERQFDAKPLAEIKPGPARMKGAKGFENVTILPKPVETVQGIKFQPVLVNGREVAIETSKLYPTRPAPAKAEAKLPTTEGDAPDTQVQTAAPRTEQEKFADTLARAGQGPIPALKQPLWQNTEQGRELTPPPPRGEVDTFTVPPETDQQRLQRRRVEGEYFGGEAPPAPYVADDNTLDETMENTRFVKRYEPMIEEAIPQLVGKERREALMLRAKFQKGEATQDDMNQFLSKMAGKTGIFKFMKAPMGREVIDSNTPPSSLVDRSLVRKTRVPIYESDYVSMSVEPNAKGLPVINAVDRETGFQFQNLHLMQEGSQEHKMAQTVLGKRSLAQAQEAARKWIADERQRQLDAGTPFDNAVMGVSTTTGVPPHLGDMLRDLKAAIGLENVNVFLYTGGDLETQSMDGNYKFFNDGIRAKYKLYGDYLFPLTSTAIDGLGLAHAMGPKLTDFAIRIDPSMQPRELIEVMTHELGHIVQFSALNGASQGVQQKLMNAHEAWVKSMRGKTYGEVTKSLRTFETKRTRPLDPEKANTPMSALDAETRDYILSFDEWFADNVAKWMTTADKPVGIIDKFFAGIAKALRRLVSIIKGTGDGTENLPDAVVADFMEGMGRTEVTMGRPIGDILAENSRRIFEQTMPDLFTDGGDVVTPMHAAWRMGKVNKIADKVKAQLQNTPIETASDQMNLLHLYVSTVNHITNTFGKLFPKEGEGSILDRYRNAHMMRRAIDSRLAHLFATGYHGWEALRSQNKGAAETIMKLMTYTFSDIDPRKNWEAHTHLHSKKDAAKNERLKQTVAEANKLYNDMRRIKFNDGRASDVYDHVVASNEVERYIQQTVSLHAMVMSDASVVQDFKRGVTDPMQSFMANAKLYENIYKARDYWRGERDKLRAQVEAYIEQRNLTRPPNESTAAQGARRNSDVTLTGMIRTLNQQDRIMQQAPYFHLGRFGNFAVSFRMKTNENGALTPETLARIARDVEKSGIKMSVPPETIRANAYFRFESITDANKFEQLVMKWEREGLVTREGAKGKPGQEPRAFKRGEQHVNEVPAYAAELVAHLNSALDESKLFEGLTEQEEKLRRDVIKEQANLVHQFFWNMVPDSSVLKVQIQRENIAGFNADMMRSYAFRSGLGAGHIAGLYTAPKMTDALDGIGAAVRNATVIGNTDPKTRYTMQNVYTEFLKREAQRPTIEKNNFFDVWRAINHSFYLGLSPAYALTNLMQAPIMLWPQLAKTHGFGPSFTAMAKMTPMALRIIRETIKAGYGISAKHAFDASINEEVLKKAGVPTEMRNYLLNLNNSGLFEMGSQSRELGRVTEGRENSNLDHTLRMASSFGFYSEMSARLVGALSTYSLSKKTGADLETEARTNITESMFEFSSWNIARATGKMGLAGNFTPVMLSFMQYTYQLIEKLMRELHTGFISHAANDKEKAAARRFLGTHLAAVTMTAGTMGLPAATIFAKVIDSMVDLFGDDDEPYDVRNAYRNWLTDTLGPDVGELISRGGFRLLGLELSNRIGEADIIPFSRLLADRRSWQDATESWAMDALGSPVNMLFNIIGGGIKVGQGDLMGGSLDMLPIALRAPAQAARFSIEGNYVDSKGKPLPLSEPRVDEILAQVMGIKPSRLAEYQEANLARTGAQGQMTRVAARYRNDLISALESGDMKTAQSLMGEIRDFDRRNPTHAILPDIGSALSRRQNQLNQARQLGTPLGVKPEDAATYDWANTR